VIEAVRRIGDYAQETEGGGDSVSTYIEDPNRNNNYKSVLIIMLGEKNGNYFFSRVVRDEFKNPSLYLYKKGAPNGTDATPTSMIAGDIKRTFDRFMKWFENYDDYKISDDERDVIRKMSIALTDQKDRIFEELSNKYSQKDPKTNAIITLGFENGDGYSHINEYPIFEKILLLTGRSKYFLKKSQGTSFGENSICYYATRGSQKSTVSQSHGHSTLTTIGQTSLGALRSLDHGRILRYASIVPRVLN
jgi:CRISPR-associated protein Csh1